MRKFTVLALLGLPLVLAACGGEPTPVKVNPPAISTLNTVTGTVSGPTLAGKSGTIRLAEGAATLAQASFGAAGTFTLPLPGEAAITPYLRPVAAAITDTDCTSTLSSSAAGTSGYTFSTLDVTAGTLVDTVSTQKVTLRVNSAGTSVVGTGPLTSWIYVNQATTLGGALNCSATENGTTLILQATYSTIGLQQGWNEVQATITVTVTSTSATTGSVVGVSNATSSSTVPSASVWYTADDGIQVAPAGAVGTLSLTGPAQTIRTLKIPKPF